MQAERPEPAEVLPLDRYIRAVSICNNLALLASQGTMIQYLQRVAILSRLQRYWTKGYETVQLSCVDATDSDNDDRDDDLSNASLVPVSAAEEWDAKSDVTVDLKPDVSGTAANDQSGANAELSVNLGGHHSENDEDNDSDYTPVKTKKKGRSARTSTSSSAPKGKLACTECGEVFRFRSLLKRHMSQKHGQQQTKEEASSESAEKSETTAPKERRCKRRRGHHQKPHHHQTHRPEHSSVPLACLYCNKSFDSPDRLREHEDDHVTSVPPEELPQKISDYRFMCTTCGRRFLTLARLQVHNRIHTGERPYPCNVPGCDKSFAQLSGLQYHLRTHSDETPYICCYCGKQFRHPGLLTSHLMTHTGAKPAIYRCDECGAAFSLSGHLRRHARVHTGEQPFVCAQCPVRFKFSWGLKRHERAMHMGEKPWTCSVCKKSFFELGNLRTHMRTHTGEKPYACPVCNQHFSQSSSMKTHLRTHTNVNVSGVCPPVALAPVASTS